MNWNERAEDALISLFMVENAWRIAMLEKALSQAMEISGIELREAVGILHPDGGGSNHPAEFRVFGHPTDAHKCPELAAYLREQDHIVEAQEMAELNRAIEEARRR